MEYGLVASFNRPGGNVTGVTLLTAELAGKRLNLLLELVPQATTVGYLSAASDSPLFEATDCPSSTRSQVRSNHIARGSLCVTHHVCLRLCRAAGRSFELWAGC